MTGEPPSVSTSTDCPANTLPLPDQRSRVVVFVAGAQPQVEAALHQARRLHNGRQLVFVCEPEHQAWVSQGSSDNVFVVKQPFNPFGRKAAELLQSLETGPIEACGLVVAGIGFESFRLRLFGLRLRTSRYLLFRLPASTGPMQIGRFSFAWFAAATLLFRIVIRLPGFNTFLIGVDAALRACNAVPAFVPKRIFQKSRPVPPKSTGQRALALLTPIGRNILALTHASGNLALTQAIGKSIFALPSATGRRILTVLARWLQPLDQPLAIGLARVARVLMLRRFLRTTQRGNEVVHVIPHIGLGGVQRQLVLLLKTRTPAYHHRVLVISSGDRFFGPELAECGVPVYYLDSEIQRRATIGASRHPLSILEPLFALVKASLPFCSQIVKLTLFLRTLDPKPDIIHCWLLVANLAGSIASRLAGVPLVVTSVRNIQSQVEYNYYDPRWQRALERATVPLASAITANAPAVATDYRAFAQAPAKKVVTVQNGLDVKAYRLLTPEERAEMRRALGLTRTDAVVGTVARLAKEKDFETFLRALALARKLLPALRAIIVGEGPLRVHLQQFTSSLGLTGVVMFLGERKDIADLIQCYDVFLLTSIIEGMPNAVMESQFLGVPVVATKAGGTVDLIKDGETGLLAPIGDYQALASALLRVLTEPGLHDKISRAASEQIRSRYTVERFVARTEDVYRALLGGDTKHGSVPCAG